MDFDYSKIDVGVVSAVRALREAGFSTTDSGDGTKAPTMECAVPFPMIACTVENHAELCDEASRAFVVLEGIEPGRWFVEGSYSATDETAVIIATAAV
jgi:hypothetical protein